MYQQNHYQMVLSRSLYTHSLDINVGVIATLLDQALDEDVKEVILAYYILLESGSDLNKKQVKEKVQEFLKNNFNVTINFEINDALIKLKKDGLITQNKSSFKAVNTEVASTCLENHWHDLYSATQSLAEVLEDS